MLKTIIKILLGLLVICVAVSIFTGKHTSEIYVEKAIEKNNSAEVGAALKCPNCGTKFEKETEHQVFCSQDCKKEFETKMNKVIDAEGKLVDSVKDVGNKAVELVKSATNK